MSSSFSCLESGSRMRASHESSSSLPPPATTKEHLTDFINTMLLELKQQRGIALPLIAMNLTWFVKIAITTAFLGRLGELPLAGGTLGFTFANVTGFSVLNGLCGAMEPICGQAFGAKNFKLLHKTLLMAILLLLLTTLPISFLWLNADKILIHFGQQKDISTIAKTYLFYLLPDLIITSFLCPLKAYLSSQSQTFPIMFSSALALALHIPINIFLSKSKGLIGVSMAIWITDSIVVILLALYVFIKEISTNQDKNIKERGWFKFNQITAAGDWIRLLKLSGPCCLTICLEWWCIEILVLLTGRLPNAKSAVGALAIVLNFDYLLYSVMLSLATCASTRVSNELGANRARQARQSANISLGVSVISGFLGGAAMVSGRGIWGPLFTHEEVILRAVKKTLLLMAVIEVVNFPLAVCGGILRGTAKPWLGLYANLGGFYCVALPLAVVLAFKVRLGLGGLLMGFLIGVFGCLVLLLVFVVRIDWFLECEKAQVLASEVKEDEIDEGVFQKQEIVIVNEKT